MNHSFDTVTDAIEAGYDMPGREGRVLETTPTHDIIITDTSGHDSYGYSFGVKGVPNEDAIRAGHRSTGVYGPTVTVWTNDKSISGQPQSFRAMFPPGELEKAIERAVAATLS